MLEKKKRKNEKSKKRVKFKKTVKKNYKINIKNETFKNGKIFETDHTRLKTYTLNNFVEKENFQIMKKINKKIVKH